MNSEIMEKMLKGINHQNIQNMCKLALKNMSSIFLAKNDNEIALKN